MQKSHSLLFWVVLSCASVIVGAGIGGYFLLKIPPATVAVSPEPQVVSTTALDGVATDTPAVRAFSPQMVWGAYVGDEPNALQHFETLVGNKTNLVATFVDWDTPFPASWSTTVGSKNKTLIIFWDPGFGYDEIVSGTHDDYIQQFAADAKSYGYPVILIPFSEMNLNEEAWGYGRNGNTQANFIAVWRHIHSLFSDAQNVKFGLAFNNSSIPDVPDNAIAGYYPGEEYVDDVGVDGFNFDDPSVSPDQIFNSALATLSNFHKPIYIFSTGAVAKDDKAAWVTSFGEYIQKNPQIKGWVWFNQNGNDGNWLVNSDPASLVAFKQILQK